MASEGRRPLLGRDRPAADTQEARCGARARRARGLAWRLSAFIQQRLCSRVRERRQ